MTEQRIAQKAVFLASGIPVEVMAAHTPISGLDLLCHWHKHLQLYQILSGCATVNCNDSPVLVAAGDVALINIEELHYLEQSSEDLKYQIFKIDYSCLPGSDTDVCVAGYLAPLLRLELLFQNRIQQDAELCHCLDRLAKESEQKLPGHELALRGCLYDLLAVLVRSHARSIAVGRESGRAVRQNRQFQELISYISDNYAERLTLDELAAKAHLSPEHFCRTFKRITGRTAVEYINLLRVEKAHDLLTAGGCNVTEAALAAGFTDTNYFSRLYKRHKHFSPSRAK